MAAENSEVDFERFRNVHQMFNQRSSGNSSDSEADNIYQTTPKNEMPKRNKRKNFKPRCSNVAYSDNENTETLPVPQQLNTNNNNLTVRRRKTLATRKVVVDPRYSPMDLSKNNDSDSVTDGSEEFSNDFGDNEGDAGDSDDFNEDGSSGERESKIPSSFSIHNLSKPHVSEFGLPQMSQGQVFDMREYAVNTMRELLGIYGLTSEVAESISRQLPIAAFNSGEFLFL